MSKNSRSRAGKNTLELIALDLLPIKQAHPEHAAIVDEFGAIANPPYLWGVWSRATIIRRHSLWSPKQQSESGLWAFAGETPEQADLRMIEDSLRLELLRDAPFRSSNFDEDFLRRVYELQPSYYLATYPDGHGKGTKELRIDHRITLARVPARYHVRELRSFGVLAASGTKELTFAARLTETEAASLRRRKWVQSVCTVTSPVAPAADNYDSVLAARNKLSALLQETYGDEGRLTVKDKPKMARLNVFLRRNGLQVMVTLTDAENRAAPKMIAGKTYKEFISRIPAEVDGFPVRIAQWTLDKTAVVL